VLLLVVTLPTLIVTTGLLVLAVRRDEWPSQCDLYLMGASFLSAWALWVPACFIGLAGAAFPDRYMIMGGIMGHAQAIINPIVYGLRWRSSVLVLTGSSKGPKVVGSEEVTNLSPTPAQSVVVSASLPPSPPTSESGDCVPHVV